MPRPVIALFRAREEAQASAAALARRGLAAALAPVIETVAAGAVLPAGPFDFAVATSAKALAFADLGALRDLPLYVVGERTAQAARDVGLAPQPAAVDVAALIPTLLPGRALYLAGADRKPDLEAALAGRVAAAIVYEARARVWTPEETAAVAGAAAALHYSPRSATLAAELGGAALLRLPQVCLSREVARAIGAAPRLYWPREPTEAALFDALESALSDAGRL